MKRPPGKLVKALCWVGTVTFLVAISVPCLVVVIPVWKAVRYTSGVKRYLNHEIDHQAVAHTSVTLLLEAEYLDPYGKTYWGDDPSLPKAVRRLEPFYVSVMPDEVIIMKAGGMVGMGLSLRPTEDKPGWYDLSFAEYEASPIRYTWLCSVQADDESAAGSEPGE